MPGKLDRNGRQKEYGMNGFSDTILPGDKAFDGACTKERKCVRTDGHKGKCWPNGKVGESSA
jgi:hypothetical protein